MSYDYSSETKQLELPNPYRVQNTLMWISASILVIGGMTSLWWGRENWAQSQAATGILPIGVGLGLLTSGIWTAGRAATRLRFFFGRRRPNSLAVEIPPGAIGTSESARSLQEILRQGALEYPEPQGPVEGILYNLVPHLITAPTQVQELARKQAFNLAALIVTLVSFCVALLLVTREEAKPWIALAYFAFGAAYLLRPVVSQSKARLTLGSVVGLIAGAILGPVMMGTFAKMLPTLHGFSVLPQTVVMLISGLFAVVLTLLALLAQVAQPPGTRTSAEMRRLSANVPPSLLVDELERRFQETWTERIPNRRYARIDPVIDPSRHAAPFAGELFEETQPMPLNGSTAPNLRAALSSARHKWIAILDLYGTVLTTMAVAIALTFVRTFNVELPFDEQHFSLMGVASILLLVALFCQHSAAELWGRFDFESHLVWVEFVGTYQTSSIGTGNALSSKINTQNEMVRVESMTLRVWRARIESVAFNKEGERRITAMFSTDKEAKDLAEHLADFGQSQSSLVAPSQADRERIAMLGATENQLARMTEVPALVDARTQLQQAVLDASAAGEVVKADEQPRNTDQEPSPKYCHACGQQLMAMARFCSACGTQV
jgi:hypothetical protein